MQHLFDTTETALCMLDTGTKDQLDAAKKLMHENPSIVSTDIMQKLEWMIENDILANQSNEMRIYVKGILAQ